MPDDYRDVNPPKLVDVYHHDRWWPGTLTAWIRFHDGRWRGMCHWNEGAGYTYGSAQLAEHIRLRPTSPRQSAPDPPRSHPP